MSRHNTTNKSPNTLTNHSSDLFINIDYSSTDEKISLEVFKSDMDQNSLVKHILLNTTKFELKNTAHIKEYLTTKVKPSLKSIHIIRNHDKSKHVLKLETSQETCLPSFSNHINEVPVRDISTKSKEEISELVSLDNGTVEDFFYDTLFEVNTPKKKLQHRMLKRVKSDMNIALRYWSIETEKELSKRSKSDYRGDKRRSEKKHLTINQKNCDELNYFSPDFKGDCTNFNIILSPREHSPKIRSIDSDKTKSSKKTPVRSRKIIVKSNTLELMKPTMKSIGLQTKIKKSRHKQICPEVSNPSDPKVVKADSKTEIKKLSNSNLTMLNRQLKQNVSILNKTLNRNLHKLDKQLKKNLPILNKPLNPNLNNIDKELSDDIIVLNKKSNHYLNILDKPLDQDLQIMNEKLNQNLNINQPLDKDVKILNNKQNQILTMSVFDCVDIKSVESKEKLYVRTAIARPTIPRRVRNESPSTHVPETRPQIPRRFINEKFKSKHENSQSIDDKHLLQAKIGNCFNANLNGQTDDQSNKQIADLCSYFKNLLETTVKSHLHSEKMKGDTEKRSRPWRRSRSRSPAHNEIQTIQDVRSKISSPNKTIEANHDIPNRVTSSIRSSNPCSCITHIPIEIEPELIIYNNQRSQSEEANENVMEGFSTANLKNVVIDDVDNAHNIYGAMVQDSSLCSSVTFNSQVDMMNDQNMQVGDAHLDKKPVVNKMQRSFTSPNKQEFFKSFKKSASVISIVRSSPKTKSSIDLNATTVTLTSIQKSLAERSKTAGSIRNSTFLFTKVNMDSNQDNCFKRRNNYYKSLKTKMKKPEIRPLSDWRSNSRNVSPSSPSTIPIICPFEYLDVFRKKKLPSFSEPTMNKQIPSNNIRLSPNVSVKHSTDASTSNKEHSGNRPNSTKLGLHAVKNDSKLSNVLPSNKKPSPNSTTKQSTENKQEKKSSNTKYSMNVARSPRSPRQYPARTPLHEEKPFNLFGYYAEPEPEPQQIDIIDVSKASNTYLPIKHSNECIGAHVKHIMPRINEQNNKNELDKFVDNKSSMTPVANEYVNYTFENKFINNDEIEIQSINLQTNPKSKQTSKFNDEASHPKLTTKTAHLKTIANSSKPLSKRTRDPIGMSSFVSGVCKPGTNKSVKSALIPGEFGIISSAVGEKEQITENISTIKPNKLIPIENISNIKEGTPSEKNANIVNYLISVEPKISEFSTKTSSISSKISHLDNSNSTIPLKNMNPSDSNTSDQFYSADSINIENISPNNCDFSESKKSKKENEVLQSKLCNTNEKFTSAKSIAFIEKNPSDPKKENEHNNNDSSIQTTKELKNKVPNENSKSKFLDDIHENEALVISKTVELPNQKSTTLKKSGIPITMKRFNAFSEPKNFRNAKSTVTDEEKESLKNTIIKNTNVTGLQHTISGLKSEVCQLNSVPKTKCINSGDKAIRPPANLVNKSTTNHKITASISRQRSFVVSPDKSKIAATAVKQKSFIENYRKESKVIFNFERHNLQRGGLTIEKKTFKNGSKNNINKTSVRQTSPVEKTKEANSLNKNPNTTRCSRQNKPLGSFIKKNIEESSKKTVSKKTTTESPRIKNHGSLDRYSEYNESKTSSTCTLNIRGKSLDRHYAFKPIQNVNTSKMSIEEINTIKKPNQNNGSYTQIHNQNTFIKKLNQEQKKSGSIPTAKKPNENKDNRLHQEQIKTVSIPTAKKPNENKQTSPNNRKTDKCPKDLNTIPLASCTSSHDWLCVHKEDKYEVYKPIQKSSEKLDKVSNTQLTTSKSVRLLETLTSKDQDKVSENWVLHKSEVVPINLVLLDYKNPLGADVYKMNQITKALCEPFENLSDVGTEVSMKITKRRSIHTIPASIKKYFSFKSKNSQKIKPSNTD